MVSNETIEEAFRVEPIETLTKPLEMNLSDRSVLVIKRSKWNGRNLVDIRVWVSTNRYAGPTKRGFQIPVNRWEDFKKMVNRI